MKKQINSNNDTKTSGDVKNSLNQTIICIKAIDEDYFFHSDETVLEVIESIHATLVAGGRLNANKINMTKTYMGLRIGQLNNLNFVGGVPISNPQRLARKLHNFKLFIFVHSLIF